MELDDHNHEMNWTTTASDSQSTMSMDSSPAPNDNSGSGGSGKKVRKPYTITKSRKSWTEDEHDKFLEALHLFDRDWKKIEGFVGSKSVIQIRSHAQKYFMKVEKNGTIAHVPPPRPKRKSAHPYPQKAPKNVVAPVQASRAYPSSVHDPTVGIFPIQDDYNVHEAQGLPDFGEVYSFIGSMFDPESQGHQQKLKEMDLINFEAVILLMRNLTINLCDPDCASLC